MQLHTDDPGVRFVPGATFATESATGTGVPHELTLRSARLHNGTWLLGFEGIPDRSGAESLRGTRLLVDREPAAPAAGEPDLSDQLSTSVLDGVPDDAWYEEDLVGLTVRTRDGDRVGEVTGLEIGPAQDLLVVALDGGGTAYVPFVTAIVPEVDIAGGTLLIDPPEGLLELNT